MNKDTLNEAVDLAIGGKWDDAHRIVQEYEDEFACWVHAVLHKIEGDESNSRYWYRRTKREYNSTLSAEEELRQIKELLNRR